MARTRPYAVVLIFILATIITADTRHSPLIAMALPMCCSTRVASGSAGSCSGEFDFTPS